MAPSPYSGLPDYAFWRRAVASTEPSEFDPVVKSELRLSKTDAIATAGSCFAQHIARALRESNFSFLCLEASETDHETYTAFSAAYGNVYTPRQLVQLFDRAYGEFNPIDIAWTRGDGALVDPFRPTIRVQGFADEAALLKERCIHLRAVRRVFERCRCFIFTLGLTEAFVSAIDGAVFPIAPGVVAQPNDSSSFRFHNFSYTEVVDDLSRFVTSLRTVNPNVEIILTVSPVPLIATAEPRHVLVSTTASKAILRAATDTLARNQGIHYFPSFEIINGQHARGRYFADDLRDVTSEGVAHVMRIFRRHYLADSSLAVEPERPEVSTAAAAQYAVQHHAVARVICDEELLDQ